MKDIKWAGASTPAFFLTKVLDGKNSFVPSTYLFHGAPESGKSFWAMQFFRAINCLSSGSLVNQAVHCCAVCKNISRLQFTDFYPIITHFDAARFSRVLAGAAQGGALSASQIFWIGQELFFYLRMLEAALFAKNDPKLCAQKDFLQTWLEKEPGAADCAALLDFFGPEQNPFLTKINVSYEYVREILKKVYLTNYNMKNKLLLVDDMVHLGDDIANFLLKTIEEPPSDTLIVMLTKRAERVLPTVRSRALKLKFKPYITEDKRAIEQTYSYLPIFSSGNPEWDLEIDLESLSEDELCSYMDFLKLKARWGGLAQNGLCEELNALKTALMSFHISAEHIRAALKIIRKQMPMLND